MKHLNKWIKNNLYFRKLLRVNWLMNFNLDRVMKKDWISWKISDSISDQEQFLIHQFCEKSMFIMLWELLIMLSAISLFSNELFQSIIIFVNSILIIFSTSIRQFFAQKIDAESQSVISESQNVLSDNKFEQFKMKDLIMQKDEQIKVLELEIRHLKAQIALLDAWLKRLEKRWTWDSVRAHTFLWVWSCWELLSNRLQWAGFLT